MCLMMCSMICFVNLLMFNNVPKTLRWHFLYFLMAARINNHSLTSQNSMSKSFLLYIYIYTYIYIERERKRDAYIYIYKKQDIYIYIYGPFGLFPACAGGLENTSFRVFFWIASGRFRGCRKISQFNNIEKTHSNTNGNSQKKHF